MLSSATHKEKKREREREWGGILCILVVEQAAQVNLFILIELVEEHLSVEVFSLLKKNAGT